MKRDDRVFLLGEDIGRYGGAFGLTHGMLDEFGEERVRETPISEATIVATAIVAALLGMRPVAEIMFMDFILLSLDQIANQAAKMRFMFGGRTSVPNGCPHAGWFRVGSGIPAFTVALKCAHALPRVARPQPFHAIRYQGPDAFGDP